MISDILGGLSLACWLVVFIPQLYTNYSTKDASSLSINFILLWLLGDSLNLTGAILCKLQATTLVLNSYFLFSDFIMLFQIYLYQDSPSSITLPEEPPIKRTIKGELFVCVLGLIALVAVLFYFLSIETFGSTLGWASCILFLSARFPQILKNFFRKSVEGLSIFMFPFCILGNATFAMSIITSPEASVDFFYKNLPWICGSSGTILTDFVLLFQFYIYRKSNTT